MPLRLRLGQSRSRGSWRRCVVLEGHRRGGETRAYRGQAQAATKWAGCPQGHSIWSVHWVSSQASFRNAPSLAPSGRITAHALTPPQLLPMPHPCLEESMLGACWRMVPHLSTAMPVPQSAQHHTVPVDRSPCTSDWLMHPHATPWPSHQPMLVGRETPFHHPTVTRRLSMITMLLC